MRRQASDLLSTAHGLRAVQCLSIPTTVVCASRAGRYPVILRPRDHRTGADTADWMDHVSADLRNGAALAETAARFSCAMPHAQPPSVRQPAGPIRSHEPPLAIGEGGSIEMTWLDLDRVTRVGVDD